MTQPDEYTKPEGPYVRKNTSARMSELTRGQTVSEDSLYSILSRLGVRYSANWPLFVPNEFDGIGRPVFLKPDAVIHDPQYGSGIFEVDGSAHKTQGAMKWDAKKDAYYEGMNLWVERLPNKDARNESKVREALERHRRKVDSYGGAL